VAFYQKRILSAASNFSSIHLLFVSFCRHQVTKNPFAEVLFQIDQLICKLGNTDRFDFLDFVL
jgi:hypothetical protein